MKLRNFFLPHNETHKKPHLITVSALAIFLALFVVLQTGFGLLSVVKPEILGVSSLVTKEDVIKFTNIERQKNGLLPLREDPKLDQAALEKAKNMYEENYWAHYSPTGKDPWGFIKGAGYSFSYAGENLARNFYKSEDVVSAWMASPTHRDNIVNTHYQDIGIAVLEGKLKGEPTILVVQEFGSPVEAVALAPKQSQVQAVTAENPVSSPVTIVASESINKNVFDPYLINKSLGLSLFIFLAIVLLLDFYLLRRRMVHRISSKHLPHIGAMAVAAACLINISRGSIL